ncbi:MAG: Unknown protein [uncultured Sulfurovum sp.]|uniref:Uncharacterized protein n=1 Tax=uncultured Sulfurovum sp. TaxID=269237 RepID=A0A6S6SYG6_9BACT|nr:MAG: Unknown protein [uncultured Sulfurovum sp.]
MFNKNQDNEADFCESYKSEILGTQSNEKANSFFSTLTKLVSILILLAIITAVSFYGYNYFMNNQNLKDDVLPPVSMQTLDEELVVTDEVDEAVVEDKVLKIEKTIEKESLSPPLIISPQIQEDEIAKIANDVKIAIAKSEVEEENETKAVEKIVEEIESTEKNTSPIKAESLEIPTSVPEAKYLEELADLSKEIDKEKKN